jgi:anti-sigma-K factor RskA
MAKRNLDIFAGEYALGTLDAEMRSEAEKLKASDAAFARAVSEWEERRRSSLPLPHGKRSRQR